MSDAEFKVGDYVIKRLGDYTYEGVIVARFTKHTSGVVRFVVEDERGLLLIMAPHQLSLVK